MTEEAAEAKTESKDLCSSKGAGLSELYKRQRLNAERPEADFVPNEGDGDAQMELEDAIGTASSSQSRKPQHEETDLDPDNISNEEQKAESEVSASREIVIS